MARSASRGSPIAPSANALADRHARIVATSSASEHGSSAPAWSAYDIRLMLARFQSDGMLPKPGAIEIMTGILGHDPRSYRDFAKEMAAAWR